MLHTLVPRTDDPCRARARITAAVPAGSAVCVSPARWLNTLTRSSDVEQLRSDARRNAVAVAAGLAFTAWGDGTTSPGWDDLAGRTGLDRRTVARWLAWLRGRGWLGLVETGSLPVYRSARSAVQVDGPRAAVYLLAAPVEPLSTRRTVTPTAVLKNSSIQDARAIDTAMAVSPLRGPEWPQGAPTKTRLEERAAADALRERVTTLRELTARHVRHLVLPWLRAGWTVNDLVHALNRSPEGTARTWSTSVTSPAGWLVARLRPWAGKRAPSQIRAQQHAAAVAEQIQRQEAAAAARRRSATAEQRTAHRQRIAADLTALRQARKSDGGAVSGAVPPPRIPLGGTIETPAPQTVRATKPRE